jgi:predicted metalloprotease
VAVGGGIIGLIIVLVGAYFGVDLRPLAQNVGGGVQMRQVGPPPDDRAKKFAATILEYTNKIWTEQFHEMGRDYQKPRLVLFTAMVQTGGCGTAPSSVGPFYCPADKTVYLDPSFFDELERKLHGSKADFSKAYVIAHEVGHHVQNLLGYERRIARLKSSEGTNYSVRLELQADYLAGVWAHYGQEQFNFIEPGDVDAAITTAKAIGDDRLQKESRGWVSPESFTHGSSRARVHWFTEGLKTGDMGKLNFFAEAPLGQLDPELRGR